MTLYLCARCHRVYSDGIRREDDDGVRDDGESCYDCTLAEFGDDPDDAA